MGADRAVFARAIAWLRDDDRLDEDDNEEFRRRIKALTPPDSASDEVWAGAIARLRAEAIEEQQDGDADFCREGLNEFLRACGLAEFVPGENGQQLAEDQHRKATVEVFTDGRPPVVNLAGMSVTVQLLPCGDECDDPDDLQLHFLVEKSASAPYLEGIYVNDQYVENV